MEAVSRTSIIGVIMTLIGFGAIIGIAFDGTAIGETLNALADNLERLWLLISGPIILFMRKITDSPMVDGIRGLLIKKGS